MMGRGESASSLVKEKRDNLYFVVKETKMVVKGRVGLNRWGRCQNGGGGVGGEQVNLTVFYFKRIKDIYLTGGGWKLEDLKYL